MSHATVLRKLREDSGLTQARLAARIGITPSVLSAYENGKREPRVDVFFRSVQAAGFTIAIRHNADGDRLRRIVPDPVDKAAVLARVCAVGMALPRHERGPLRYPPFRLLTPGQT